LRNTFSIPFLAEAANFAGQGHNAIFYLHTDALGMHGRLPFQFVIDVLLEL
jgi:hypothetical protein